MSDPRKPSDKPVDEEVEEITGKKVTQFTSVPPDVKKPVAKKGSPAIFGPKPAAPVDPNSKPIGKGETAFKKPVPPKGGK